ncbi:MAG: DUF4328 domain-containing protein [Bacillota bacterium]
MEKQLTYVSARKLAKWMIRLTAVNIILQLMATGIILYTTFLLNGFFPSDTNKMIFYSFMGLTVTLLDILCFIILSMIYLCWINRVYRNIIAFGATGIKYTPGKSVSGFLIPFINLTRPPAILQEIWKASDPGTDISSWKSAPQTLMIGFWWVMCLLSVFMGMLAIFYWAPDSINLVMVTLLTITANICLSLAAVLSIVLINAIDQRQEISRQIRFE